VALILMDICLKMSLCGVMFDGRKSYFHFYMEGDKLRDELVSLLKLKIRLGEHKIVNLV